MSKPDSTRDAIRKLIAKKGSATGPELSTALGITRQAVSLHLRQLIAAGDVFKSGSTRAARYFPGDLAPAPRRTRLDLALPGLDESVVYSKIAITMNLATLSPNVEAIAHYAFTEMLNNAIDHSLSDRCTIEVCLDAAKFSFIVKDRGIGVFQSIASKKELQDEPAAMIELIKGKTTTMPDAHSGEGIFFASKAADRFVLRSHRLQLEWDRERDDVFVSDVRYTKGTLVQFEIRKDSRTRLSDVFAAFAPEEYDYRFEKTRVQVKLLRSDYVSRSEAKRLLHNLDRFSEIELDFRGVRQVGQGFADEVFRVFATAHPGIVIRTSNTAEPVTAMVRHVKRVTGGPLTS
jgi:anti-sigma regulatory factor (Ser/Thr protein kinase)